MRTTGGAGRRGRWRRGRGARRRPQPRPAAAAAGGGRRQAAPAPAGATRAPCSGPALFLLEPRQAGPAPVVGPVRPARPALLLLAAAAPHCQDDARAPSYAAGRLMQSPAPVCTEASCMAGAAAAGGGGRRRARRPAAAAPAGARRRRASPMRGFAAGEPGSCGVAGARERRTAAAARCITQRARERAGAHRAAGGAEAGAAGRLGAGGGRGGAAAAAAAQALRRRHPAALPGVRARLAGRARAGGVGARPPARAGGDTCLPQPLHGCRPAGACSACACSAPQPGGLPVQGVCSVWVSNRVGLPPASACAVRCTWLLCGYGVFWQRPAGL